MFPVNTLRRPNVGREVWTLLVRKQSLHNVNLVFQLLAPRAVMFWQTNLLHQAQPTEPVFKVVAELLVALILVRQVRGSVISKTVLLRRPMIRMRTALVIQDHYRRMGGTPSFYRVDL